ncbi:HU family DNA-binding protein [Chitinibacter sp. ZOR0017]|uniref:HU family DNA-binding protein n=1 Tax=Chitinibacter sp. ZOR0017 TaxID=1339254 RepID=UPI00064569C6|nr:HU family DNA-binding protein [Chitinibacter sp. ZOR0017]
MNKPELIQLIAANADLTQRQAEDALNALTSAVLETVRAGNEIRIPDLGKFSVDQKPARPGRNPRTGETIQIEAKRAVKFTAAKALKDWANR